MHSSITIATEQLYKGVMKGNGDRFQRKQPIRCGQVSHAN